MPDARPIIRLSEPARAGTEADLVREVLDGAIWHGDGPMTQRATYWLRERLGAPGALMTSSCTHALDMAARLIGLGPGDEAIVPSFTFPSTATAVALTGATPVFVDVWRTPSTLTRTLWRLPSPTERARSSSCITAG